MPLLDWDPPPLSSNIYAKDLMTQPVISFTTKETVENIVKILKTYSHNGFPVIEYDHNYCELVSELNNNINLLSPNLCCNLKFNIQICFLYTGPREH